MGKGMFRKRGARKEKGKSFLAAYKEVLFSVLIMPS